MRLPRRTPARHPNGVTRKSVHLKSRVPALPLPNWRTRSHQQDATELKAAQLVWSNSRGVWLCTEFEGRCKPQESDDAPNIPGYNCIDCERLGCDNAIRTVALQ